MKRSEINQYIREAKAFMTKYHFMLPPWADWTPDDWKTKGPMIAGKEPWVGT